MKSNPINIARIDHVVIRVRDLRKMVDFYSNVLGCRLERGPGEALLAQLRAGDSLIDLVDAQGSLGRAGGQQPDHDAPNVDHICLFVDPWEPEALREQLNAHGIECGEIAPRYGATGMGPSLYLKDPEGNTIELKGTPP